MTFPKALSDMYYTLQGASTVKGGSWENRQSHHGNSGDCVTPKLFRRPEKLLRVCSS